MNATILQVYIAHYQRGHDGCAVLIYSMSEFAKRPLAEQLVMVFDLVSNPPWYQDDPGYDDVELVALARAARTLYAVERGHGFEHAAFKARVSAIKTLLQW